MAHPVSPLAPARFPELPAVAGVRLAALAAGIKYKDRNDLLLVELAEGSTVAGVFTRSQTAGAPVLWCRQALVDGQGRGRAFVVNSGNSNAFTGRAGQATVRRTAEEAARLLDCRPEEVFVASTGVIGQPMPEDRVARHLPDAVDRLGRVDWAAAAGAIMTTDTYPKGASRTATLDGREVTIVGIAKGSGMIAPDMATMLSFVVTDAAIPAPLLQEMLADGADRSFNSITVDGDTSTSDTLLVAATGRAGNAPPRDPSELADFRRALDAVLLDLAHQVVRDGEGAQKFIDITVTGAESDRAARRIGLSIANSPLVKTAIAGEDANWGRVVMAVGKSGEKADRDRLAISMGGVLIARDGGAVPGYDEAPVAAHMKGREITIEVDVGVGTGRARVWTCDLTHEYIAINADYRS